MKNSLGLDSLPTASFFDSLNPASGKDGLEPSQELKQRNTSWNGNYSVNSRGRHFFGWTLTLLVLGLVSPLFIVDAQAQERNSTNGVRQTDRTSRVQPRFTVISDGSATRGYHEINEDLRAFMRRDSMARKKEDQVAALLDLCALFEELKQDPRVADSPTLLTYKNKLWSRLTRIESDIRKQMARQARLEKTEPVSKRSGHQRVCR